MKFTKIFWGAVLVCFLWQWALGQKPEKPAFPLGTYKTTARLYLKDEYRLTMCDTVIAKLNEAISFYPNDAELHFLLGKAYYYKNMPKKMGQQFSQAESLKIDPKFYKELQEMRTEKWLQVFNQGAKAFNEQKQDTALEKFTICTILDPQNYRGFMNVGYAYSLKGENDKAISYLQKGLKLAPDTLDLLRLYAVVLHNAGKTEEALEIYSKIIKKDPTDASALNNIVSIYVLKKDLDKALLFCQKMIDVDSSFKDAYFNMGWIYVQQIQEVDRALDSLKDATGVYRTDEKSKVRKEELEKKRGELFTKAEDRLRKTVELDSSDIDAQLLLAQVYLDQEKLDQAVGSLEFLVQKDSTNCEALRQLWAVYAKKGIADKANETRKKAEAQGCLKKE